MTSSGQHERFAALEDRTAAGGAGRRVLVRMSDGRVSAPDGTVLAPGVGEGLSPGGRGLVLLDRSPVSIRFAADDGREVRRVELDGVTLRIDTDGVRVERTL